MSVFEVEVGEPLFSCPTKMSRRNQWVSGARWRRLHERETEHRRAITMTECDESIAP
jgi:hypothetical protein